MTRVPSAPIGRRTRGLIVAAAVTVTLAIAGVTVLAVTTDGPSTSEPTSAPTPEASPSASSEALTFERPADWSTFRPTYHLTPGENWVNDPQRPIFAGGEWHLYYLYNADYPDGNGTEWYHATSDDLISWRNQGVAIEKYRNGLGDILTGSTVVDTEGTAGFGKGAIIALVTQQDDGIQRQSLFFSTDDGYSFEAYEGNPVMQNPGVADWRDPKVMWDAEHAQWTMVLAEGERLGFYVSENLRDWTYASDFARDDLGLLECPDLFEMTDASGRRTWILAASADGGADGRTTGLAYWTGTWDGTSFTADVDEPLWLDDGADFYAGVTWEDPRLNESERLKNRYALAWVNNWAYARELPPKDWHGGALSITRQLTLEDENGRLVLRSRPADAIENYLGHEQSVTDVVVDAGGAEDLAVQPDSGAYRLRITFEKPDSGDVRLRLFDTGEAAVTVGYDAGRDAVFVNRELDSAAAAMPDTYRDIRTTDSGSGSGSETVTLDILVDYSVVEVFVDDGRTSLTTAVFPARSQRVSIEVAGPDALEVHRLSLSPIAVAQQHSAF